MWNQSFGRKNTHSNNQNNMPLNWTSTILNKLYTAGVC